MNKKSSISPYIFFIKGWFYLQINVVLVGCFLWGVVYVVNPKLLMKNAVIFAILLLPVGIELAGTCLCLYFIFKIWRTNSHN